MKKILLLFSSLLFCCIVEAQNLVPNPSFEVYDTCPDYMSQINRAVGWWAVRMTPDYFNACSSTIYSSVPTNGFGHTMPASGNAYAGFIGYWQNNTILAPECFAAQLLSPLIIGTKYY